MINYFLMIYINIKIYSIKVINDCIFKNWNIKIKIKKARLLKIIIYAILINNKIFNE